MQKHLEAVNKAKEEEVLAVAQKQAEAHLRAQHEAIANAQKQAQEAAYAKIAAHNQGLATLKHPEEVSALQARPLEQVLANPLKHQYGGAYSSSEEDLRHAKPVVPQIQYQTASPPLYSVDDVPQINYSPVSPYTPHLVHEVVTTPKSVVLLQQPLQAHQELVAEHEEVSFVSKRKRRGVNISLDSHGKVVVSDLVQRRKNDDLKNIIVINNSNQSPKNTNILHVPQYFNKPPKVIHRQKPLITYKKVIPKILRAEHKVQIALQKVG